MDINERPKDQFTTARIRSQCRDAFDEATPYIKQIALGTLEDTPKALSLRAYDHLGKYGIGRYADLLIEKADWLKATLEVTAQHIPNQEDFERWHQDLCNKLQEMK